MAVPRPTLFAPISWLSRLMAGSAECEWRYWFHAQHRLTTTMPDSFDAVAWQLDHTRLVSSLRGEFAAAGWVTQPAVALELRLPGCPAVIRGTVDLLALDDAAAPEQVVVIEAKTGRPRTADQVQVLLYLLALGRHPRFAGARLRGLVRYRGAEHAAFFAALLAGPEPLPRVPGPNCAFCPITRQDCTERVDAAAAGHGP